MTKRTRTGMTSERSGWRDLHVRHSTQENTTSPERNDRPSDNFLGNFMSDGTENGGKTPKNGTIHHVFRHFDVGRSEQQHFPEDIYTG